MKKMILAGTISDDFGRFQGRVSGLGFGVGFQGWVSGSGFVVEFQVGFQGWVLGLGFRVSFGVGFWSRVWGRVLGLGFGIQGRVSGFGVGFLGPVSGSGNFCRLFLCPISVGISENKNVTKSNKKYQKVPKIFLERL